MIHRNLHVDTKSTNRKKKPAMKKRILPTRDKYNSSSKCEHDNPNKQKPRKKRKNNSIKIHDDIKTNDAMDWCEFFNRREKQKSKKQMKEEMTNETKIETPKTEEAEKEVINNDIMLFSKSYRTILPIGIKNNISKNSCFFNVAIQLLFVNPLVRCTIDRLSVSTKNIKNDNVADFINNLKRTFEAMSDGNKKEIDEQIQLRSAVNSAMVEGDCKIVENIEINEECSIFHYNYMLRLIDEFTFKKFKYRNLQKAENIEFETESKCLECETKVSNKSNYVELLEPSLCYLSDDRLKLSKKFVHSLDAYVEKTHGAQNHFVTCKSSNCQGKNTKQITHTKFYFDDDHPIIFKFFLNRSGKEEESGEQESVTNSIDKEKKHKDQDETTTDNEKINTKKVNNKDMNRKGQEKVCGAKEKDANNNHSKNTISNKSNDKDKISNDIKEKGENNGKEGSIKKIYKCGFPQLWSPNNNCFPKGKTMELYGIVYHKGKYQHSGHYYCKVMNWITKEWYLCNDDKVEKLSASPGLSVDRYYHKTKTGNNLLMDDCEEVVSIFYFDQDALNRINF